MDTMKSNMIGNLVSSIVTNKYKLDTNFSMVISMIVSSILLAGDLTYYLSRVTTFWAVIAVIFFFVWYCGSVAYENTTKKNTCKYMSIRLYTNNGCGAVRYMMRTYPEFYTRNYDMEIGNPKFDTMGGYYTPTIGVKIEFNDTIHNVKGYICYEEDKVTKRAQSSSECDHVQSIRYLNLSILKDSKIQCDEYIMAISKLWDTHLFGGATMTLWSVKVMTQEKGDNTSDVNNYLKMYEGVSDNHEERRAKWFDSYFSPNKAPLWEIMSTIQYHPEKFHKFGQSARSNLLLHGPGGTGKSSFVHRLAMSLGRHIISVDLTASGTNRSNIYQIIQSPVIKDRTLAPKEYIILLEEFDIVVDHLTKKNKRPKYPTFRRVKGLVKDAGSCDEEETPYHRSTRELELEDLKEILQGPVPLEGGIIIATTNKYETIKEVCPELFRPGRLTPVKFGYLDWASLQELSRYYFDHELSFDAIETITVSSAEIIELAMLATFKCDGGDFEFFEKTLYEKLTK